MPRRRDKLLLPVSTALTMEERISIDKMAQVKKTTRGALVREAVRYYIKHHQKLEADLIQSPMEEKLDKIEERIRSLIAKLVLVSGQTLYVSLLPYLKGGLPTGPLTKHAYTGLWDQSEKFAVEVLKRPRRLLSADESRKTE